MGWFVLGVVLLVVGLLAWAATRRPRVFGPGEVVGDGKGGVTGTRAHEFRKGR